MTDLAELKKLAAAATPGPLEARYAPGMPADCVDFGVISHATGKEVMRVWSRDDAELYAALSPDGVTALIERIERAEAALLAWRDWDLADDAALEMTERADAEGWLNDPAGSMHVTDAYDHAHEKRTAALALRDTALAALETK